MTSPITCHVLDSALGRPAEGVEVRLELLSDRDDGTNSSELLGTGQTNADGRCTSLLPSSHTLTSASSYRLTFLTGPYFARDARKTFYPRVEILFTVSEPAEKHYHVPLLLSPFGYTTYRGS
ncbi:Hydroxyisourate hydrolase [Jaminaea rosea]|uniref:5-hydroxyisourate hydrolase n=1 Tax=Jaminaea rosea TaxID=1569628 RepID=A0A316UVG2_9BASI|nr:Hydroxyisourate hydrolase [Jaminaea rosea]PWN27105.1 Hydroxyisourate hydrolase [Jaminaea rosea]